MPLTRNKQPKIPYDQQMVRNLDTGCLEWTGTVDKDGYGRISVKRRNVRIHRYWYEKTTGPIPEGHVVCHKCDNPRCVEPSHLFLDTHAGNVADKVDKKRQATGEGNGNVKVTEAIVRLIRADHASGARQVDLALKYQLHQTTISQIVLRKTWQMLEP